MGLTGERPARSSTTQANVTTLSPAARCEPLSAIPHSNAGFMMTPNPLKAEPGIYRSFDSNLQMRQPCLFCQSVSASL